MLRLTNIKIPVNTEITQNILIKKAAKILKLSPDKIKNVSVSKKSIDSRDKKAVLYVLSVDAELFEKNLEKRCLALKNVSEIKYTNC